MVTWSRAVGHAGFIRCLDHSQLGVLSIGVLSAEGLSARSWTSLTLRNQKPSWWRWPWRLRTSDPVCDGSSLPQVTAGVFCPETSGGMLQDIDIEKLATLMSYCDYLGTNSPECITSYQSSETLEKWGSLGSLSLYNKTKPAIRHYASSSFSFTLGC